MMDQLYDRNYQDARAQMNADIGRGLDRLAAGIAKSLKALHRLQFEAPWATSGKAPTS